MSTDLQKARTNWFRSLEPVPLDDMIGLWRGVSIPSGHPLDGVLENLDWFGKRIRPDLRADALLFQRRGGRLVAIEPAFFLIRQAIRFASLGRTFIARNWFSYLHRAFRARGTTASLNSGRWTASRRQQWSTTGNRLSTTSD